MAKVTAIGERVVDAPVERVLAALADYGDVRPRILTDRYSGYAVHEGGRGAGTLVSWTFHATSKRVRECLVDVTEPAPGQLLEKDRNSSQVTILIAAPDPADAARTVVRITTSWDGASGIGGFFERRFAPAGLRRTYEQVIENLEEHLKG